MPQALERSEGCWAWVVLLASVVTQGLTLGFPTCIGIFFTELQREFQASNSETSWFPSILTAMLHAGGEQGRAGGWGPGVGWDAGRDQKEPWGEGRQPQPLWPPGSLSLGPQVLPGAVNSWDVILISAGPVPPPRILWGWAGLDWAGEGHRAGRPPRCKAGSPDECGRIKPDRRSVGALGTERRGFPRGDLSEPQFFPLPFVGNSQQPQAAHLPHRVAEKITGSRQV